MSREKSYVRKVYSELEYDLLGGGGGAFAKFRNATITFVMSVRLHGKTRLPLDGFLLNLIFAYLQ
jgi:hypothetical protein